MIYKIKYFSYFYLFLNSKVKIELKLSNWLSNFGVVTLSIYEYFEIWLTKKTRQKIILTVAKDVNNIFKNGNNIKLID